MNTIKYIKCFLFINNFLVSVDDVVWDCVINELNNSFYLDSITSPDPEELEYTDWFIRKDLNDVPVFFGRVLFLK